METNGITIKKLALGVGAVLAISIVIMLTIGGAVTDNTSAQANLRDGNMDLAGMSSTDFMLSMDQASFEDAVDMAPIEDAVDRAPFKDETDRATLENAVDMAPIEDAVDEAPYEEAVDEAPIENAVDMAPIEDNVMRESTILSGFIWMSCIFLVGYCYWGFSKY